MILPPVGKITAILVKGFYLGSMRFVLATIGRVSVYFLHNGISSIACRSVITTLN